MGRESRTRLCLIGNGAIAKELTRKLSENISVDMVGALVLPEELGDEARYPLTTSFDDLLSYGPNLIVECASHGAVKVYAAPVLDAGLDFMIISIGALSDLTLEVLVREKAAGSKAQVILPAGALSGIDGLAAAARAGLSRVELTTRKPPLSWSGAPGVEGVDLESLEGETIIFSGTAREAAQAFPKNANVAATVALAGIGFEKTQVTLLADPAAQRNTHVLEYEGRPGRYRVECAGLSSEDNPKTSMLTAYNILRAIESRSAPITF